MYFYFKKGGKSFNNFTLSLNGQMVDFIYNKLISK